jgi:zinc D-Ala-D-Ala carboxypeptidase
MTIRKQRVSKHVSYHEAVKSRTAIKHGIDNTPNGLQFQRMKAVARDVFEPVRKHFGKPIFVSSFFRCPEVNEKAGGSSTSQHCKGEAMDLDADVLGGMTNAEIFYYIREHLIFDQMIWEHGDEKNPDWVHVSYKEHGGNKRQLLRAYRAKNWRGKYVTKYKCFDIPS